jgi:K(+)-stimulated pyrophosphate-energized sodium pump
MLQEILLNEFTLIIFIGLIGILFALILATKIQNKKIQNKKVEEISLLIKQGAKSYLGKQYKILAIVAIVIAILLSFLLNLFTGIAFIIGAILSSFAGYAGMMVATSANARTTEDCKRSLQAGLKTAFSSGVVMGLTVVSLGLLGVTILYLIFKDLSILFGFGFGASLIALFARVGGGIYTKAADVGADLVGKVEAGIPEDDPRNPATIADNVGDNVGDVAGMGADLFESYIQSIIAAMTLGIIFFSSNLKMGILFPLMIAGFGIIASIIGTFFVKVKKGKSAHKALNKGIIISTLLTVFFSFLIVYFFLGLNYMNIFYVIVIGLGAGMAIGFATEYYTSDKKKPVKSIAKASETGAATNVIKGLSVGMLSTVIPVLVIVIAIIVSFKLAGLFGIAIAAVGMLSTLGITLATDTYGPVADNAAGIAEMSGLGKEVRERAESLDAVGNTTAAIGKGFAIGSAALTALALFSVYGQTTGLTVLDILSPAVLSGLFIGALLPFVFSALTMDAVGKAALSMVKEVRMQFKNNKDIMTGKAKPDYKRPIEISTKSALKQMLLPGVIAVLTPILVGLILGTSALGGLLAGTTITGFLLAVVLSNAGGAWDNAKKFIEAGNLGGKGSDAHKAAVIGDTVGDPAKDTSGPSLNILIKIVSIVALIFAMILML